jgi:hypothetical protein
MEPKPNYKIHTDIKYFVAGFKRYHLTEQNKAIFQG